MDDDHPLTSQHGAHPETGAANGDAESTDGVRWSTLLRLWVGRVLGPLAASAVYVALGAAPIDPAARATAAVGALMALWWMTEAMPLPMTSLLPVALFPLLGIADIEAATRPFASSPLLWSC